MRLWLIFVTIVGFSLSGSLALAGEHGGQEHGGQEHGGQEHGGQPVQENGGQDTHEHGDQTVQEHKGKLGLQKVTGEVVDLACYLSEGLRGPGHRECAEKCISSGLPVGIKTKDRLYLVMGGEHGPANGTLAPLAAKNVTAEGIVTERDGIYLLAVKKVTVNE